MRHLKLIEVLGLILALGAWGFEWWSMRKWDTAFDAVGEQLSAAEAAHDLSILSYRVNYEAATTRALMQLGQEPATSEAEMLEDYSQAWGSPRVRSIWVRVLRSQVNHVEFTSGLLRNAASRHGLGSFAPLQLVEAQLDTMKVRVKPFLGTSSAQKAIPVPDATELPFEVANEIDGQLAAIEHNLLGAVSQIAAEIRRRADQGSSLHRVLFVAGSLLLVGGRFLEWLAGGQGLSEPSN